MTILSENQLYRYRFLLAALVSAVVFAAYTPALLNGFVNFDDSLYVYDNPAIRSLDLKTVWFFFANPFAANWHPLTMVSLAIDYALWGLDPFGYHLTNIVVHSLNAFLTAFLTMRLIEEAGALVPSMAVPVAGAVAALLFGLHPMRVESVAWASERKDVLCGLFFLLSLLCYTRYASTRPGRAYYPASLIFAAFSLLSKPMAVTLPLVLLILDFYPLGRLTKGSRVGLWRVLLEKLPFVALSLVSVGVTLGAQQARGSVARLDAYPLAARVFVSVKSVVFYLYKTFLPFDLCPFYPLPTKWSFSDPGFMASAGLVLVVTAFAVLTFRSRRYFLAAWLYYIVTLLPVLGIVQAGRQAAADRYMYLPAIGLFVLVAAGAGQLYQRYSGVAARVVLSAVFLVVSALMAYATVTQEAVWKDSLALWTHEIKNYPLSHRFVYVNRGLEYQRLGRLTEALADFNTAAGIPATDDTNPYINRGHVYSLLGDLSKALADFDRSIRLFPADINAYYNRGLVYQRLGNCAAAVADYSKMISYGVAEVNSHINRGICYAILGNFDEASKDLESAASLEPGNQFVYLNLGKIYSDMGRAEQAALNFKKAAGLGSAEAAQYLRSIGRSAGGH